MLWITLADYVGRYGAQEILNLTNDLTSSPVSEEELRAYALSDPSLVASDDVVRVAEAFELASAGAQSEAESYLGLYKLPFEDGAVPLVLINHTYSLIRYELFRKRLTEEVIERRAVSEAWLVRVGRGVVRLGADAAGSYDSEQGRGAGPVVARAQKPESRVFGAFSEDRFMGYG